MKKEDQEQVDEASSNKAKANLPLSSNFQSITIHEKFRCSHDLVIYRKYEGFIFYKKIGSYDNGKLFITNEFQDMLSQ